MRQGCTSARVPSQDKDSQDKDHSLPLYWKSRNSLYRSYRPFQTSFPVVFVADHDVTWHGIIIWSIWVSCPLPASDPPLAYLLGVGKKDSLDAQQQQKYWCVINIILVKNPKHGTCRLLRRIFTPPQPDTVQYQKICYFKAFSKRTAAVFRSGISWDCFI